MTLPGFKATGVGMGALFALRWVFLHMTFIGLLTALVGWFAEGVRLQRAFARLLFAGQLVSSWLDVRAADWALGTALYRGPGSLGPVVVGAVALVAWGRLCLVAPRPVSPS